MSDLMTDLNTSFVPNLVMFAWNKFGMPNSIKAVTINSVNSNQMGLTLSLKDKTTKDVLYTFTPQDKIRHPNPQNPAEITNVVSALLKKSSFPHPPIGAVIVGLFLWFLFIVGSLSFASCPTFLLGFKSKICFSSTNSKNLLTLMLILHAAEACYVITKVSPFVRVLKCKFAWAFSTIILGFPVTQQAILLSKLQTRRVDNKKNS